MLQRTRDEMRKADPSQASSRCRKDVPFRRGSSFPEPVGRDVDDGVETFGGEIRISMILPLSGREDSTEDALRKEGSCSTLPITTSVPTAPPPPAGSSSKLRRTGQDDRRVVIET